MSDFLKKFLVEDARRLNPSGRFVGLAAFGKHPGWDDHVEDLGLETESLNFAKTLLYVNGIGGQIDSGAWEKLDAAQGLPAFNHLFVWQRSGQILIGRLWSSSDGKGRKRYPMVVCLHFTGVTLGWALKQALPALAELADGCAKTTSAEDVRNLLKSRRAAMREAVQSTDNRGEYAPISSEALHKILQPGADAKPEGFLRVLYQVQSQLGAFAPGKFNANAGAVRAQQIRVPVAGENPEQALLFWTRFFLTHVDVSVPLLLTLPLDADWVDVTAGEPESHEFFALRASPKAVPLVSEVPYTLDAAFRVKATAFLAGFQRGETKEADLQTAVVATQAGQTPVAAKSGWLTWLGVGAVVIVAGVGVMLLVPKGDRTPAGEGRDSKVESRAPASPSTVGPRPSTVPAPAAIDPAKAESVRAKVRLAEEAEAGRLAEEKKKAAAMAAAARMKSEAEAAAAKEKERHLAEAARITQEKETAARKELEEQARLATEAKAKADEKARTDTAILAATPPPANPATPAAAATKLPPSIRGEMTNSIGMILVSLPSGFWVGKFEVTQAEYLSVMKSNPSKSANDRQPVEKVSWNEAVEFCRRLTEMEQGRLPAGKYSLPTEKQWKEFFGGQKFDDIPGGVTGKSGPSVVGQSGPANQFGLFDVLGNVWEWSLDGATGDEKLLKGGSFKSANDTRTLLPDKQVSDCGFRCVVNPS